MDKRNKREFCPFAILLCVVFVLQLMSSVFASGSENYHWRSFTKLDGLISNNVNAIAQDKDGNLWFATSAGVSKFDGLWHMNEKLYDNNVIGVAVDDSGRVWFGTSGGVSYFDSSGFKTTEISDRVLYITRSMQNEIWVGTNKGAIRFDGNKWTQWTQTEGHLELGVTAIFRDTDGKIWFGINSYPAQLSRFDGASWSNYSVMDGLPVGRIQSICEDSNGNIWIGTSDGAAVFDGNSWKIYTVRDGLAGNNVRAVMLGQDNNLWFATDGGLSLFNGENWQSIRKADGLVSNDVRAVFEDRAGGIWVGTGDRGVSYTDRKWQSISSRSVLPDDTINAIFEDSHGNMWFGTPKGLVKFDGKEWTTITTVDGLPGDEIRAITELHNGELWVGTDRGIGVYDGISWTAWTQSEGFLGYANVHAISADTAGNVWVGTGLYIREPNIIDRFGRLSKFDGLSWKRMPPMNSTVSSILEDSRGNLWVCTYTDGIRRINGDSIDEIRTEDGLTSNSVFTVVEHPNGAKPSKSTIWFGTERGINIFDNGKWSALTTDHGLADNRVRAIFMDRQNQIWVGTADGVSLFRDNMWISITVNDGLISNRISSIYVSNNGDVWFGTDESGLTRHIREEIPPKTRIVNGPKGTIGVRTVTFEYIGGDASTSTDQLLYSYRLNNSPWSPFDPKTFVTFSNLADKKDHLFLVRTKDKDGNIDPIGAKALFTIDASLPFVRIDDPLENQVISGIYEIKGSAIDESDFKEYRIKTTNFSTGWISNSVENGTLALWDTQNLADGVYTIKLSARDKIDGESDIPHTNQTTVKVEVDNTKPYMKIISPVDGSESSGVIRIEAEISDRNLKNYKLSYTQSESKIQTLDTKNQTSGWRQIYFESATRERVQFEYSWDSSNVYGETTLRVSAEDAAGNVGFDDVKVNLKNDSAKPTVKIDLPVENQVIAGNFSIMGTADDTTLKEFLLEYSYGVEWKQIRRGNYPIKSDVIAIWNTERLSDGIYTMRLTATDDNGYTSSTEHAIKVDNTEPVASIDFPKNRTIIQGSVNTEIIGTAYDENFAQARLEYSSLEEPQQWYLIGEPILSAKRNETLRVWNSSGYEGKYQVRLTVTDLAENRSTNTQIVTVDSLGVELKIVEPTESQVVSGKVTIIGTARDVNFGYCSLYFRKEPDGDWQDIVLRITEPKENEPIGIWDSYGLDGIYSIRLFAEDLSGNSNEIEINRIRVDNSLPVVSIDYPKDNQQIGSIVELSGTAADDNLLEYTIEYSRPDAEKIKWDSILPAPFTKSVHSGYLGTWNLPEQAGRYWLKLKAVDLAGHQNETVVSVSLPPMIDAKRGGIAFNFNEKYRAQIVIPPNSLPDSTVITVNEIDKNSYDFAPEVVFNPLKPATITISYSAEDQARHIGKVPSVFFYEPDTERWQEFGGTIDQYNQKVTVAVNRTGRYALRWVEPEEHQSKANISDLTCQPRVFRPNRNQFVAISFELSSAAEVTVKIYNFAGRLKRLLKENVSMRKGSNVLHWDGKDEDINQVPSGPYIVTVQTKEQIAQKSVVVWND